MGGCTGRSSMKNAHRYLSNFAGIGKEGERKPENFHLGPFHLPLLLLLGHANC